MAQTKKCSKCKLVLPIEEFSSSGYCKKCHRDYMHEREQTPEHKAYQKDYHEKNAEKIKDYQKKRRQTPEWKARMKDYREKNKDKIKTQQKAHYKKNKERIKIQKKARRYTPEYKTNRNKRMLIRLKTNPILYLKRGLKKQLCMRLKSYTKNGKVKTSSEYGIDYDKIIKYLEPTIEKQKGNHIDHIVPASRFDLNNEQDIQLCFSAENLQWLSGLENHQKLNNVRREDLLELQRRINEDSDKLDINTLKQLILLGLAIYSKQQNKLNDVSLVAIK